MNWHVEYPIFLWFVLLLPVYLYYRYKIILRNAILTSEFQYIHRSKSQVPFSLYVKLVLETFLFLSLLLALASPYKSENLKTLSDPGIDILFVLDISASMQAADLKPSRLEVLKKMTTYFIDKRDYDRIGLILCLYAITINER